MADLVQKPTRKSAAAIAADERVMKARAGHASFARSFSDMAGNVIETGPRAVAFISGMGGASNLPEVAAQTRAQKADVLDVLPEAIRRKAERFDSGTQKFVALVYKSHKATAEHVSFTDAEAGTVMDKDADSARRSVEALASAGIITPYYSGMGLLKGYLPGHAD